MDHVAQWYWTVALAMGHCYLTKDIVIPDIINECIESFILSNYVERLKIILSILVMNKRVVLILLSLYDLCKGREGKGSATFR